MTTVSPPHVQNVTWYLLPLTRFCPPRCCPLPHPRRLPGRRLLARAPSTLFLPSATHVCGTVSRHIATSVHLFISPAGGSHDDDYSPGPLGPSPGPLPLKYAKYSNAYMLVYVRVNDWPSIMCDTTKDDIAKHLLDRLEVRVGGKVAGDSNLRVQCSGRIVPH